jgi:site-specific DNA-methyltransferase (adenine-specific)
MVELNKIYNMDCLLGMKQLDDCCIDLTVTSPPYDNLRTYDGFEWDFEGVADELYRVTKDGGVVVWIVNDATVDGSETLSSFKQALYFQQIGFNVHDTMIWHKPGCFNFGSNYCYKQSFEYMFIFSKGRPKTINFIRDDKSKTPGMLASGCSRKADGSRPIAKDSFCTAEYKKRENVWAINPATVNNGHPAVFPERLANDHIISWSNPGDVVLDPFMGSGTTAKMALLNDRKFIGFELSEKYHSIAEERIYQILVELNSKLW